MIEGGKGGLCAQIEKNQTRRRESVRKKGGGQRGGDIELTPPLGTNHTRDWM